MSAPYTEHPLRFRAPAGAELTGFRRQPAAAAHPLEVLFLPGNGFPVQAYRPALAGLPPDTSLHALNPQGHGGSTLPARSDEWDDLLADLRAYVEAHLHPPLLLAGHSMGAMLCMRLAAEHPERVAGLLLLEPPLRLRRGETLSEQMVGSIATMVERTRFRWDGWPSREKAAAWMAKSVGYKRWDPEAREAFLEAGLRELPDGSVALATPPALESAYYDVMLKQDLYALADAAQCPAVLLSGLQTFAATPAGMQGLAEAMPVGVVLPVPGTHTFPMEHPHETAQRIGEAVRLLRGETGLAAREAAE